MPITEIESLDAVTIPHEDLDTGIEAKPVRLYELRVLPGCPKQNIAIGSAKATFQAFAGNPALDAGGVPTGPAQYMRQYLDDEQVQAIRDYVSRRVVLPGEGGTGNVYERGHSALRGRKDARPLAEFLSLRPLALAEIAEDAPVSMAGPIG